MAVRDALAFVVAMDARSFDVAGQAPPPEEVEAVPPEELQPARFIKGPMQPSAAEVEEHEATGRVVYRSWCPICQAARSTGQPHLRAPDEEETAVPQIIWDYGFMGEADGESMPILVIKDRKTKRVSATFVQAKGQDAYAIKSRSSFLQSKILTYSSMCWTQMKHA